MGSGSFPAARRRSKGNWTAQIALRGLPEAPSTYNPARSRPLNLSTSSAESTLGVRGTNPALLFLLPSGSYEKKRTGIA